MVLGGYEVVLKTYRVVTGSHAVVLSALRC